MTMYYVLYQGNKMKLSLEIEIDNPNENIIENLKSDSSLFALFLAQAYNDGLAVMRIGDEIIHKG